MGHRVQTVSNRAIEPKITTVPESFSTTPSSFSVTNMTLRNLITIAYRIHVVGRIVIDRTALEGP